MLEFFIGCELWKFDDSIFSSADLRFPFNEAVAGGGTLDRDSLVPEDAERELNVVAMIAESDGNEATESVGQGTEQDEHSGN